MNTCPQNYKFTGKERDTETGNDDFGARYYSSRTGRWLSPDWSAVPAPVPYADVTNPQTLNLYQYVKNDPETLADPDGHLLLPIGITVPTKDYLSEPENTQATPAPPPQNQNAQQSPDQVQQVIQAQADAKKKAIAEQTRTPSEQDKKDALVKAGKMADAGVKAGLVVVGAEAAVAGAVVAGPAAVTTLTTGSQALGAAAETYVPGGVGTLNQIPDAIRGWRAAGTTPGTIPQTPGGLVGAGARAVYEIIKALW